MQFLVCIDIDADDVDEAEAIRDGIIAAVRCSEDEQWIAKINITSATVHEMNTWAPPDKDDITVKLNRPQHNRPVPDPPPRRPNSPLALPPPPAIRSVHDEDDQG